MAVLFLDNGNLLEVLLLEKPQGYQFHRLEHTLNQAL
jgi:hypothetical protein